MAAREWIFTIDKLTNSLEEAATGRSVTSVIDLLKRAELKGITKKAGWHFNWREEFNNELKTIYKLVVEESVNGIQGLISITDAGDHLFLPLVETAPHNFGHNKKYYGVLGNLTAFACRLSFEKGYGGEVAFVAKTSLIPHYKQQLGAILLGGSRMAILSEAAAKLVSLYFKDFKP